MKEKIDELFIRIEDRLTALNKTGLPVALTNLVTLDHLKDIYSYVLSTKHKETLVNTLSIEKPYCFHKENTKLARTLNFVIDPVSKEIWFILESKSKQVDFKGDTKKVKITVFSGSSKSVKPAWRIDTPTPLKMSNAVYYAKDKDYIDDDLNAIEQTASIATEIVKHVGEQALKVINVTAAGVMIPNKGTRRHTRDGNTQPYFAKQSYYSEYALGDLDKILHAPKKYPLTNEILHNMVYTLLFSAKFTHAANVIHHDIKPENILVYPDADFTYRLALTDFDVSYHPTLNPNADPLATIGYESPEILALHVWYKQNNKTANYNYFHNSLHYSYGKIIYLSEYFQKLKDEPDWTDAISPFKTPDSGNEMWALGVTIKEMYERSLHLSYDLLPISAMVKGLLAPTRASRMDIDGALEKLYEIEPNLKQSNYFLPTYEKKQKSQDVTAMSQDMANLNLAKSTGAFI